MFKGNQNASWHGTSAQQALTPSLSNQLPYSTSGPTNQTSNNLQLDLDQDPLQSGLTSLPYSLSGPISLPHSQGPPSSGLAPLLPQSGLTSSLNLNPPQSGLASLPYSQSGLISLPHSQGPPSSGLAPLLLQSGLNSLNPPQPGLATLSPSQDPPPYGLTSSLSYSHPQSGHPQRKRKKISQHQPPSLPEQKISKRMRTGTDRCELRHTSKNTAPQLNFYKPVCNTGKWSK